MSNEDANDVLPCFHLCPFLDAWLLFLSPSFWCGSFCTCDLETCRRLRYPTQIATMWLAIGDGSGDTTPTKVVMRWTCASCGESKNVRFDSMKKYGPGKHKCSKQPQRQEKEANAKAKDGRPSVTPLHCHQLAAKYGCDWLGVVVDNAVRADDSLVSSICVMPWQCWGCTTNFDRTYHKMKSRGFVCSTCNAS